MQPEEFNQEENKLRKRFRDQLTSIKAKYKVRAVNEDYEPGDAPELISARKECIDCRDKYNEDYENLKKQFFNSFIEIEHKNKELEKKLENKNKDNKDDNKDNNDNILQKFIFQFLITS